MGNPDYMNSTERESDSNEAEEVEVNQTEGKEGE